MTSLASVILVAAVTAAGGPAGSSINIQVQLGGVQHLQLDSRVERVAVSNPSVATVRKLGDTGLEVRGVSIGHTLALIWSAGGNRSSVIVYVDPAPVMRPTQVDRHRPSGGDGLLNVYRASVRGTANPGRDEGVEYTGQHHSLTSVAPVLGGTASADVELDAPSVGPTQIQRGLLRYDSPVVSVELGDLTTQTLTLLGSVPQVRGGSAAYHDGRFQLLFFGGVLRAPGEELYNISGPAQLGAQTRFYPAENLSLSLQGVRTATPAGDSRIAVSPAMHYLVSPELSLDLEGGVHSEGTAARARIGYDGPLLSASALYQALGSNYVSRGTTRTDFGQLTFVLTPSSYYQLMAVGGRAAIGAPIWSREPAAETNFGEAVVSVSPWGSFRSASFHARYQQEKTVVRGSDPALGTGRNVKHAEVGFQDWAPNFNVSYGITGLLDRRSETTRGPTGSSTAYFKDSGGRATLLLMPFSNALLWTTELAYLREQRLDAVQPTEEYNVYTLGQGLGFHAGLLFAQLYAYATREQHATYTADTWSGSASIALRPTSAHELRADLQVYGNPPYLGRSTSEGFGLPKYYSGMITYTQYFGPAVDAPGLLDLVTGASVRTYVFLDTNEDGVRQPDEPGIGKIGVWLDDSRLDTESTGAVRFSGLAAGSHELRVDTRTTDGMKFTTASQRRLMLRRDSAEVIEIGLSDRAQILGTVFNDANLDGEAERGELGLRGVRVKLVDGTTIDQTASETGSFSFKGLAPGAYYLEIDPRSLPPNHVAKGLAGSVLSNGHGGTQNGHNGQRDPNVPIRAVRLELEAGQVSVVRIPVIALRSIEGRVFLDRDRDGKFSDRDQPSAGVIVRAGRRQAVTDAQGRFLFRGMPAGAVALSLDPVSIPAGRVPAGPAQVILELPSGPSSQVVDFVLRAQ